MNKILFPGVVFFGISLLFYHFPANAQNNDNIQIVVPYKIRHFEEKMEHHDNQRFNDEKNDTIGLVPLPECNEVEDDGLLAFPTTAVQMQGSFYVLRGRALWVPPDPGEAGKSTIAGIDSDGDCVRDDIEIYIVRLLPRSQKKARNYLYEYARWRGVFLRESLSEQEAKDIANNLYKSSECVRLLLNNDPRSSDIIDRVFSKFHNTFPRSFRYIDNNALLGGSTREHITVSCP